MQIADTSFLYALFSETDEFHARALREAGRASHVSIPAEILSETLALIHYRQGFQQARAAGEWIRAQASMEICSASRDVMERTWRLFGSSEGRLSYPDSIVIAWCQVQRANPLAFDESILGYARS